MAARTECKTELGKDPMPKVIYLERFPEISNKSSRLRARNAWVNFRCLLAALAVIVMHSLSILRATCAAIKHLPYVRMRSFRRQGHNLG